MPIYEYLCETCDHKFEVKQKFSDPPVDSCIKCGKNVRKLISVSGIMFKGTGWYVTDYSDKLKDPNQSPPSKGTESSNDKSNGGSEAATSKDSAQSGSSTPAPTNDSGSSSSSKESNSSSSSTPSTSSSSSSSSTPSNQSSS